MDTLVSVVIPVKNGEEFLDEVLTIVLSQETDFTYEVIVIDSGSSDGSLEIARKHKVNLIQIEPFEFNHGLTRNLGVENSTGEFIAFLTQDATPINSQWLKNLVSPLLENAEIAGVFGKHLPRPNCDPIVAENLNTHFEVSISLVRKCWRKDEGYENDRGIYVFFSNNNSCIRRSVWQKIPFRNVEMSEDQWWAQDILENGYSKCYEPNAIVYHSHTYSSTEWFKRQFDEYRAYTKIGLVEKTIAKDALKSFWLLSMSDVKRVIKTSDLSKSQKAYWSIQRILNNFGMIAGQFWGSRYDVVPNVLARRVLSQQSQKMTVNSKLVSRVPFSIKKISNKVREIGIKRTFSLVTYKLFIKPESNSSIKTKDISVEISQIDLPISYKIITEGLKSYKDFRSKAIPPSSKILTTKNKQLEFVWLVPFFSKGSGGHKNLFRFVKGLEKLNCKCTVYIVAEYSLGLEPEEIKRQICEYFESINAEVKIYSPGATYKKVGVLVCTSWITAYAACTFDADLKVYFVQDYEPRFYSSGSYWYLAEHTYSFGYYHITLGPWLTHFLKKEYSVQADYYDIVVDKDIYYPRQQIKNQSIKSICDNSSFKICFYGRNVTPRRCFEIVVMALHLFAEQAQDITLICYGWNDVPPFSFPCHSLGMLSTEELAELYSACDICIAPSATNLSLVAREVMACGCVIMDINVENTSFDLAHLSNSYLVEPDPASMCEGLLHLYNDRKLLTSLKMSSLEHVRRLPNWQFQVKTFYNLLNQHIQNSLNHKVHLTNQKVQSLVTQEPRDITSQRVRISLNQEPQNMITTDAKTMTLRDYLSLKYISGDGIEIGALHKPIRVTDEVKVKYVDRSNIEDLKTHYLELAGAGCKFVDVDIIDDGESLSTIPNESQDFVIANHFIEHCEDPIRTLHNHLRVLKSGGILYMAVPDKTLTFDRDRPVTTPEHMIADYLHGAEISREAHFNEWVKLAVKAPEDEVASKAKHLMDTKYSIHFHVFTIESFLSFVFSVKDYIGIPFDLVHFCKNEEEIEFICIFQKKPQAKLMNVSQLQGQQTQAELERLQSQVQQSQAELKQLRFQVQQTQEQLEGWQSTIQQNQAELEQSRSQGQHLQTKLEYLQIIINAMESSKFWKIRTGWFQLKKALKLKAENDLL